MKKNSIVKVSQRCEGFDSFVTSGICAETVFKENGKKYYFILVCVAEGCYLPEEHLSMNKSCFDYYTLESDDEDFEEISDYKGAAPLNTYSNEMAKMIIEKMQECDFDEDIIEDFKSEYYGGNGVYNGEDGEDEE